MRRIMRIYLRCFMLVFGSTGLPLACLGQVDILSQRFTLNIEDKSIEEVFTILSEETGYELNYTYTYLDRNITKNYQDERLEEIIRDVWGREDIRLVVNNQTIDLIAKPKKMDEEPKALLKGTIKDESNEPLPGVAVRIGGTSKGTITNAQGQYLIEFQKSGSYEIEASYLGFEKKSKKVQIKAANSVALNFSLTPDVSSLDEVVVIGETEAEIKEQEPLQVESLQVNAIAAQVRDLSEALVTVPGVQIRSDGSLGGRANISLNGLSGQAVRTYIDGLPFEFVYPFLSITDVPMNSVRRMDVYKGVVPSDVGTDAMAGAINIISENYSSNYLSSFYTHGSFNTHQAGVYGSLKLNELISIQLNASYNYSDNDFLIHAEIAQADGSIKEEKVRKFNDAYEMKAGEVGITLNKNRVVDHGKVSINYSEFFKEVNNGLRIGRISFGEVFYEVDGLVTKALFEKQVGKLKVTNNLAISLMKLHLIDTSSRTYAWDGTFRERLNGQRGEINRGNPSSSDRNQDSFINRATLIYNFSESSWLSLSNVHAYQNILGRNPEISNPDEDFLSFPQTLTKNVTGLLYGRQAGKFSINVAGKYYFYEVDGRDSQVKPISSQDRDIGYYAALKYDFDSKMYVKTSFERGIRIPNAVEFFGDGTVTSPNTSLVPEESSNLNIEFGIASKKASTSPWRTSINGFLRNQKNLLQLDSQPLFPAFINQRGVRTLGFEFECRLDFLKKFSYSGNLMKLSQVITELDEDNVGVDLIGTPVPNTPDFIVFNELKFNTSAFENESENFSVYAQYYFVDTFNHIPVGGVFNPDNWVPVQHRVNIGFSLSFLEQSLNLSANVFNVLDEELFDNFSAPRPGRNYNLRLQYKLHN
ncbi:MAG: TonB-dependent receptor, partial [Bacteroidota bacterium]